MRLYLCILRWIAILFSVTYDLVEVRKRLFNKIRGHFLRFFGDLRCFFDAPYVELRLQYCVPFWIKRSSNKLDVFGRALNTVQDRVEPCAIHSHAVRAPREANAKQAHNGVTTHHHKGRMYYAAARGALHPAEEHDPRDDPAWLLRHIVQQLLPVRLGRRLGGSWWGARKAAQVVANHQQWSQFIGILRKLLQALLQRLSLLQQLERLI